MPRAIIDVPRVGRDFTSNLKSRLTDHVLGVIGNNDTVNPVLAKVLAGGTLNTEITLTSATNQDGSFFFTVGISTVGGDDVVVGPEDNLS